MFTRKKSSSRIGKEENFGCVNSTRTFNVRRTDFWSPKILNNIDEEGVVAVDYDEHDKKQESFFDCALPEANDEFLFGATEELPPPKSAYTPRKVLESIYFTNFASLFQKKIPPAPQVKQEDSVSNIDIIQLSDDEGDIMIVEDVTQPFTSKLSRNAREQQLMRKVNKLSAFLKNVGIEETNYLAVEEEKNDGGNAREFVQSLKGEYLEVALQLNRRKTTFLIRPDEEVSISRLLDPPAPKKMVANSKAKDIPSNKKYRSSSPVMVDFSGDEDAPLMGKEIHNNKKESSAPKRPTNVKYVKRVEDEVPKIAPLGMDIFVPKKDNKLRSTNLNDLLRNKTMEEARLQREKLAMAERKRREKADELVVLKVNNKKDKKDGQPSLVEKTVDSSEPVNKRVRSSPPSEVVDILDVITSEMDAQAALEAAKRNEMDKGRDEWVPPRYEPHMPPTSFPPRFETRADDDGSDMDVDVCDVDSPVASPRPVEKTISPACSDSSGIEVERRQGLDGISPRMRDNSEVALNERHILNMDETSIGDALLCENFFSRSSENVMERVLWRLRKVDEGNMRDTKEGVTYWMEEKMREQPKLIAINSDGTTTDPRVNIGVYAVSIGKETEARVEKKKKGVKWGDTATKEFNPDDEEERPIEMEKKSTEVQEVTGVKSVGGREYKIVKTVHQTPAPPKPCLKTVTAANGQSTPDEDEEEEIPFPRLPPILNPSVLPTIRINVPSLCTLNLNKEPEMSTLSDLTHSNEGLRKPDERSVQDAKKWKDRQERKLNEEREKREREEEEAKRKKEKRDGDEQEMRTLSTSSSPEVIECSSSMRDNGERGGMRTNRGIFPSLSMGSLASNSSMTVLNGDLSGCHSMTNLSNLPYPLNREPPISSYVKGSEIVGDIVSRECSVDTVKYQLDMRWRVAETLDAHKTLRVDPKNEYPSGRMNPTTEEQRREQETYNHELTMIEKDWKRDGIQPVWMQSLPLKTTFTFDDNDGLYWPVVQATDKVNVDEKDFESVDVIRSLGNHTHFATEKKTLLGLDTRLPNGMTHKERVESFLRGDKIEPRFKNRRMHSRVFSTQSEEDARIANDKRKEKDRKLLREHEEVIKKNAPLGVSIEPCKMPIGRPDGFKCFNNMVQYYKRDDYETDRPYSDPDWYCTKADFYMPYTERVNYLCKLINHYNSEYNQLYKEGDRATHITLDLAAFAAAQIEFAQMEPFARVGMSEDTYCQLMVRNKERNKMLESSDLELAKYGELCELAEVEHPFFHFIIDWLASTFNLIKPISDWHIEDAVNSSFRENVMLSDKKDRTGRPRDEREVFYESYKAIQPSDSKMSRMDGDEYD